MVYVLLCIFSSTLILSVFKLATHLKQDIFKIILINYLIASIPGVLFSLPNNNGSQEILDVLPWASIIGLLFIAVFFLVGKTTEVSGMAITSIASKMSVVIPVLFSIFFYHEPTGKFKILGILLAIVALFMAVYSRNHTGRSFLVWFLPIVIFFGHGIVDSIVKYTQAERLSEFDVYLFNTMVFGTALIIGLIIWPFRKKQHNQSFGLKSILLGIALGMANFGSLYAMVMALGSEIDSSLVFLMNNTGVVVLASLTGVIAFKEKLNKVNIAGITLAVISIILLSIQAV